MDGLAGNFVFGPFQAPNAAKMLEVYSKMNKRFSCPTPPPQLLFCRRSGGYFGKVLRSRISARFCARGLSLSLAKTFSAPVPGFTLRREMYRGRFLGRGGP